MLTDAQCKNALCSPGAKRTRLAARLGPVEVVPKNRHW